MTKSSAKKASRRPGQGERTMAEVVTLLISILLLTAIVGGLVYVELQAGNAKAGLKVTPKFDKVYERAGAWYLPVDIENNGDLPTDAVRVDLVRPIEGEEPEIAELEFTFIAGGETVSGVAIFDQEPTKDSVEVDEISYTEP
jgi:uncharacterized protein (TIGR02588 family)